MSVKQISMHGLLVMVDAKNTTQMSCSFQIVGWFDCLSVTKIEDYAILIEKVWYGRSRNFSEA